MLAKFNSIQKNVYQFNINQKKLDMRKLMIGLLVLGLTTQAFSQITKTEQLSEVVIVATNYKYLNQVSQDEVAIPVKLLQRKVATYDVTTSDFYDDEYDYYSVSFFIPEGKVLAAYDKDGKIIRTVEKYKDIALPKSVINSVVTRFPGWTIAKDAYLVNYHNEKGVDKKYKLTLENGDQRLKIKTDAEGNFL